MFAILSATIARWLSFIQLLKIRPIVVGVDLCSQLGDCEAECRGLWAMLSSFYQTPRSVSDKHVFVVCGN